MKQSVCLFLCLILCFCLTIQASELHVGSGQTYATITGAVAAASGGDTIIVHSGTYHEAVTISKSVEVKEAIGEVAVLEINAAGQAVALNTVNNITWDGIDIIHNYASNGWPVHADGLSLTGLVIKNCTISDGPNAHASGNLVEASGSELTVENCIITSTKNYSKLTAYVTEETTDGPWHKGHLIAINTTVTGPSTSGAAGDVIADGVPGTVSPDWDVGAILELNNSTVTMPDNNTCPLGFARAGGKIIANGSTFTSGNTTAVIWSLWPSSYSKGEFNGCIFDCRKGAYGTTEITMNDPSDVTLVNCALLNQSEFFEQYNSGTGQWELNTTTSRGAYYHSLIIQANNNPILYAAKNCTFISLNGDQVSHLTTINTAGVLARFSAASQPIAVTLQNNIFWCPENSGTGGGIIRDGNAGGTLTLTAGTNLRWGYKGDGSGGVDQLSTGGGTIIDANPKLESTFPYYHIASDSPAINAGQSIGVDVDIDGDSRTYNIPDLGCDEYVGSTTSANDWWLYTE